MYDFSVIMALADYIPVAFFTLTAVLLLRDLYPQMSKACYVLLAGGSVNVFMAGFFKATWKLLYAADICDFKALEEMFMPVNSIGLLLVGLSLVLMLARRPKNAVYSAAPLPFLSSMPFILLMVLGLGGLCTGLSVLAARMKKKAVIVLFLLSFVCAMGMGYMSSQDSTQAWVNWTEQGINCISQGCLLAGVWLLHKNGLADMKRG